MTKPVKRKIPLDDPGLPDPTPAEARAIVSAKSSLADRPGRVSVDLKHDGGTAIHSNPHTDGAGWMVALQDGFASSSVHFANDSLLKMYGVLNQCGGSGSAPVNAALALIGGIAPQDELQTAIAVQIVVTHSASIHMTDRAIRNANAGHVDAAASYTGMATKLSRTMVAHVEALTKLRGGGRQVIEHRYINVNAANAVVGDNTQAVFGDVPHAQGGNSENVHQPHETPSLGHEPGAAMPCPQSPGDAMPSPRDEGAEALLSARR